MELFWSLRIFSVSRRFIWTCTKRQIIGIARKAFLSRNYSFVKLAKSYSINDEDDIFLDIKGIEKSIYVAEDIPFLEEATGSHYLIDDLLTFLM